MESIFDEYGRLSFNIKSMQERLKQLERMILEEAQKQQQPSITPPKAPTPPAPGKKEGVLRKATK